MREWLVIESSRSRSVFADDEARKPIGYIPRDVAEEVLGRDLGSTEWFTRCESDRLHAHPEWRDTLPPLHRKPWYAHVLAAVRAHARTLHPDTPEER